MNENSLKANSFEELHKLIRMYDPKITIYRGVKDASYQLTPKVGRNQIFSDSAEQIEKSEKKILRLFKERAIAYIVDSPPHNDWEWLALAQHYGLPTRLLDWTRNPLTAAYFAVEDRTSKTDGAIYVYKTNPNKHAIDPDKIRDPFDVDIVRIFNPAHVAKRIVAQDGLFTVHPQPREVLEDKNIEKIVIPVTAKESFRQVLHTYGVHEASLFPGLDGLANYLAAWQLG